MYNDSYAYKVEQLAAMRDYERKQASDQQYGANLSHWSGHGKPINLDADALQALIDHYYRLDSIERYQAAKAKADAESAEESKEYTYCVDTYACASFTVRAKGKDEAEEKAQDFIDSDSFFTVYRQDCDFFEPTVDVIIQEN